MYVYEVEDHLILHSGRPTPCEGEQVRGDREGIALSPETTRAWRDSGGEWDPISSRIVTARLKMKGSTHLYIVSMYAPTFRYPDLEKEHFYTDLLVVIDRVSDNDLLVVMGDKNASNEGDGQCDKEAWFGKDE